MTAPKIPKSRAELEAVPIKPEQRLVAYAYMGGAKYVRRIAAEMTGHSYKSVKRTLSLPHVVKFMDEELRKMGYQTRAVRNEVIKETFRLAKGNIVEVLNHVMDDDGHIDPAEVKKLPANLAPAVKTLKIYEERNGKGVMVSRRTEITMHDKVGALALMDKMLRISQEDPEEEANAPDDLRLMGMVIEGPDNRTAIDAEFEVVEKESEGLEWLNLPRDVENLQ